MFVTFDSAKVAVCVNGEGRPAFAWYFTTCTMMCVMIGKQMKGWKIPRPILQYLIQGPQTKMIKKDGSLFGRLKGDSYKGCEFHSLGITPVCLPTVHVAKYQSLPPSVLHTTFDSIRMVQMTVPLYSVVCIGSLAYVHYSPWIWVIVYTICNNFLTENLHLCTNL